ncbi:hypothetical protein ANO14919_050970 [Xylariales sp. No.14919]|nr:hypothetical protein ANO14919_050970 [Xylariales sp. No.14919]
METHMQTSMTRPTFYLNSLQTPLVQDEAKNDSKQFEYRVQTLAKDGK